MQRIINIHDYFRQGISEDFYNKLHVNYEIDSVGNYLEFHLYKMTYDGHIDSNDHFKSLRSIQLEILDNRFDSPVVVFQPLYLVHTGGGGSDIELDAINNNFSSWLSKCVEKRYKNYGATLPDNSLIMQYLRDIFKHKEFNKLVPMATNINRFDYIDSMYKSFNIVLDLANKKFNSVDDLENMLDDHLGNIKSIVLKEYIERNKENE